jgi:hypothetical protein
MTTIQLLYREIGEELQSQHPETIAGKMFGMPILKINGKAFAGLAGDEMVFKLTGSDHARAMALKGARLFDPSEMNRPMKEWVVVPSGFSSQWKKFAMAALQYVAVAGEPGKNEKKVKKKQDGK